MPLSPTPSAVSQRPKSGFYNLYLDDSGTRHPSKAVGRPARHGHDWFALGGVLVGEEDEETVRTQHKEFCDKWEITTPLHSSEIRATKESFAWIDKLDNAHRNKFYEELYCLMRDSLVLGIACVVDRPGYNERYMEKYNQEPWLLCKTAFNIVTERAAKYAKENNRRLRIYPERCNKKEDRLLKSYYDELKESGMPFEQGTSAKYNPLSTEDFSTLLYDLKFKRKSSPLIQLADLYLWPMCIGGYDKNNRPFKRLQADEKLVKIKIGNEDSKEMIETKYSCFNT